jgi:hypothetical protein
VRLDEEDLAAKLPRRRQVFLRLLTPPLEVLELLSETAGEIRVDARIADARVDVLAYQCGSWR